MSIQIEQHEAPTKVVKKSNGQKREMFANSAVAAVSVGSLAGVVAMGATSGALLLVPLAWAVIGGAAGAVGAAVISHHQPYRSDR